MLKHFNLFIEKRLDCESLFFLTFIIYIYIIYIKYKGSVFMLENKILDQIKESKTAFHAVNTMVKALLNEGYQELFENESWKLKEGKYIVRRNNSS